MEAHFFKARLEEGETDGRSETQKEKQREDAYELWVWALDWIQEKQMMLNIWFAQFVDLHTDK